MNWIAVDWGTSNLRAWRMDGASSIDHRSSGDGMGGLQQDGFEPALLRLIGDWINGPTQVIACGMVGSRQGWTEAKYMPVPSVPMSNQLVRPACQHADLDVRIIPGLSQTKPHFDVMRGEETQIAGFLTMNPDWDGILCLPGSHTKWVHVSAGEVVSFQTYMTGETFAALTGHTVLRHSVGTGIDGAAFDEAVGDALSRPERNAQRMFGIRAEMLLAGLDADVAAGRLSGLLIGAEIAAARPYWLGQNVAIVGDAKLAALYDRALKTQGAFVSLGDATGATLAGLWAAYQKEF